MIRVLIVDDETWARKRIAALLKGEPDVTIVGECADGAEAVEKITMLKPDLVFLDVQMPEMDGFDVIDTVGPDRMPRTIFATAFEEYAIRAFDAQAMDYLLKPFDEERFRKSLDRARRELHRGADAKPDESIRALIESLRGSRRYLQRLVVKSVGRVLFMKTSDIDWIEASGNYVTLHIGKEEHLLRETMNGLEPKLDPAHFVRIHRSTIVNLDRIRELQPWFRGEQVLVLKDGTQLTVGRAFRPRLEHFLENRVP